MDYTQKFEDCYRVYLWTDKKLFKSYVCCVYLPNIGLSLLWDSYVMDLKEEGCFIEDIKDYDKSRGDRDFKNTVMCQIEHWVDSVVNLNPVFKKFGRRRQNVMLLRHSLSDISIVEDKVSLIMFTNVERESNDDLFLRLFSSSLDSKFNMIKIYSGLHGELA
jgi:hypothetical protein